MENKTIQEQIKDAFEKKLFESSLFTEPEVEPICDLLYQKVPLDQAVKSLYGLLGGESDEDSST